jgi:hypothetical protein
LCGDVFLLSINSFYHDGLLNSSRAFYTSIEMQKHKHSFILFVIRKITLKNTSVFALSRRRIQARRKRCSKSNHKVY